VSDTDAYAVEKYENSRQERSNRRLESITSPFTGRHSALNDEATSVAFQSGHVSPVDVSTITSEKLLRVALRRHLTGTARPPQGARLQ